MRRGILFFVRGHIQNEKCSLFLEKSLLDLRVSCFEVSGIFSFPNIRKGNASINQLDTIGLSSEIQKFWEQVEEKKDFASFAFLID